MVRQCDTWRIWAHDSVTSKRKGNSSDRVRAWAGPTILTYGYRPFFLMAGAWAGLAMAIWVAMLAGWMPVLTRFDPISWHAHEMLFGFLGAVLAGFLLTAVPNWTGRLPIIGWPLAGLVSLWLIGRMAVAVSGLLTPLMVAGLDLLFPTVLAATLGREIFAGRNKRNLPLLALLLLFIISNSLFHASAARGDYAAGGVGYRMGLAVAAMLVTLIGGRVIPSFTRNWLVKRQESNLPAPFGPIDQAALAVTLVSLIGWVALPHSAITAVLCALAGFANLFRLSRWSPFKTRPEALLWILHVGYLFVPVGFLAIAVSTWDFGFSPPIGAQHIWMVGAIGVMPLAMMTRASLGHSGRPLSAGRDVTAVYCLVLASVVMRFIAAFDTVPYWLLYGSALCWIAGFLGFCVLYWSILTKPRSG